MCSTAMDASLLPFSRFLFQTFLSLTEIHVPTFSGVTGGYTALTWAASAFAPGGTISLNTNIYEYHSGQEKKQRTDMIDLE